MENGVIPGWYAAAGDPPGTQRYWDGLQWIGDPVPAAPQYPVGVTGLKPIPGNLASYGKRVIGFLADLAFLWVPLVLVIGITDDGQIETSGAETIGYAVAGIWLIIAILNTWVLQGITGQSIGKRVAGTRIVKESSGEPVGVGFMILRVVLPGFLGMICGIFTLLDYLWPTWDEKNQRLADKMLSLLVIDVKS